ncbi:hypothetical protein PCANC_25964 [Puccinia coronata f. sp. avenae]|uniref:dynamin GTPase n=1 Tax=Puccinia coronata f. sp. avenae TaxID=200324 RepID=A0A2N5RZ15_9BASI|nr:hypothetical protein PCANC_25964 [Puccinia coronata f. sp. avenae]
MFVRRFFVSRIHSHHQPSLTLKHSFSLLSTRNHHHPRRMLSTALLTTTRITTGLQLRHMSFISAATRVAARTGGRVIGMGAVGVGGAAYVGSQVDDFKNNLFGTVSTAYSHTAQTLNDLSGSAQRTITHISNGAHTTFSNISSSVDETLSDLLCNMKNTLFTSHTQEEEEEEGRRKIPDDHSEYKLAALSAIGLASTASLAPEEEGEHHRGQKDQATAGLMHLTRKLIQIRSLLMSIDKDESLVLPSIVVIGSQSSGKSSVLEAIVGHEFLPKGNNMVTRRPLELTLIHTPQTDSNAKVREYVECPEFGPGQYDDFGEVQRRLTRLNEMVPDTIAVDGSAIHLRVYSPHVPDLSLVDLPGYVQISAMDQPEELREKISQLCERYIRKPNIILSVCAADVDLANSPALRASKKVDPHGYRTIGVVTKLDLVDPAVGAAILANDKYRLALGYIGVICKPSHSTGGASSPFRSGLLKRSSSSSSGNAAQRAQAESEFEYFKAHADQYDQPNLLLGTDTLKTRLIKVLEESMSSSLHDISNRVSLELEEAAYQYKVQYNDRQISPDTYVAESMDMIKRRMNEFSRMLVKPQVRGLLKQELEQRVLGLLAEIYWTDRRLSDLSTLGEANNNNNNNNNKQQRGGVAAAEWQQESGYWVHKLEAAQSRLTKGGIGRSAAELVGDEIRAAVARLLELPPLMHHPGTASDIRDMTDDILARLKGRAADHVEIGVMPFRYSVEMDKPLWETGRARSILLLEQELDMCNQFRRKEKAELKKNWRLREALERIEHDERQLRLQAQRKLAPFNPHLTPDHHDDHDPHQSSLIEEEPEDSRPAPALLDRARTLREMEQRAEILQLRLLAVKSKRCKTPLSSSAATATATEMMGGQSPNPPPLAAPVFCPEIFLNILADRLAGTAADFINIDLLHRFFSAFPHELNSRLVKRLDGPAALDFARENSEVRMQIELQDRKEKLEMVMRELAALAYFKQNHAAGHDDLGASGRQNRSATGGPHKRWNHALGAPASSSADRANGRSSWSNLF